jgi:hypothetical protein
MRRGNGLPARQFRTPLQVMGLGDMRNSRTGEKVV